MCTREQYQGADRTFAGEDEHVDAPLARRAETLPYRQSEGMDGVFTSDCQMVRFPQHVRANRDTVARAIIIRRKLQTLKVVCVLLNHQPGKTSMYRAHARSATVHQPGGPTSTRATTNIF